MSALSLQALAMILAGWVNRAQQKFIDLLPGENQALREQMSGGRLLCTDVQWMRLVWFD